MQYTKASRTRLARPAETVPGDSGLAPAISENDLAEIRDLVSRDTTADLNHYRADLVRSAVARRAEAVHGASAAEYLRRLRESPEEARNLWLALQANPGGFFRQAQIFEVLRSGFQNGLWKNRRPDVVFRAWVPGCGTGEKVYSVAIAVTEMLEQLGKTGPIRVIGTELDEQFVDIARSGIYAEALLTEIGEECRSRFFSRENEGYRTRREVRDVCLFAQHNIAKDAPFSNIDLIVFPKQLPLFSETARNGILERLHYSLKPGGALVLDSGESAQTAEPWFTAAPGMPGIYLRAGVTPNSWLASGNGQYQHGEAAGEGAVRLVEERGAPDHATPDLDRPPEPQRSSPAPKRGNASNPSRHVQALLEEQVRTIEALQIANEEIIAANEELHVTIEELAATREELLSANKELATLNGEMRERHTALSRSSAELMALVRNIDAAVLTVDADLRVRRFSPRAARLFSLADTDVGRPVTDLQSKLQLPELETLLQQAIEDLALRERTVLDGGGQSYHLTVRPYRDEAQYIAGAIVTAWPAGEPR